MLFVLIVAEKDNMRKSKKEHFAKRVSFECSIVDIRALLGYNIFKYIKGDFYAEL